MQIACSRCDTKLAKILIDAGADVNQTNEVNFALCALLISRYFSQHGESLLHFLAQSWRDAGNLTIVFFVSLSFLSVQQRNLLTLILLSSPSLIDIPDKVIIHLVL